MIGDKYKFGDVEWEWDGIALYDGYCFSIPFAHQPSVEEADAAMRGWKAGYQAGLQTGRSILQNDFRNLMGLQR